MGGESVEEGRVGVREISHRTLVAIKMRGSDMEGNSKEAQEELLRSGLGKMEAVK